MQHYTQVGVVKALASQLVAVKAAAGQLKIKSPRQYRDAVVAEVHRAFVGVAA